MPPRTYTIRPPTNPILQVLYLVVGGILLIGAVIVGAVVLALVLGFAVVIGLVVYARVWWLSRKLARGQRPSAPGQSRGSSRSDVLEVEYTVVSERDEGSRPAESGQRTERDQRSEHDERDPRDRR